MNKKEQRAADKAAKAASKTVASVENGLVESSMDELAGVSPMPVAKAPKAAKAKTPRADGLVDLPKLKRVRKPKDPKDCACGCGLKTKGGRFVPGHDARLHGWAKRIEIGLIELKDIPAAGEREAVRKHMAAGAK